MLRLLSSSLVVAIERVFFSARAVRLSILLISALGSSRALAAEAALKVRLVYSRVGETRDCSDEEVLRSAVGARLGFDPFDDSASTTIDVRVERKERQLTSVVRVLEGSGPPLVRTLTSEGKDCAELSEAMALAVALAIDPLATGPRPPAVSVPPHPPSPAGAPKEAPRPPRPEVEDTRRWHFQFSVLGALGSEPGPTGGLALGSGLRFSAFSLLLEARADLPGSLVVDSGRVEASLLVAGLLPCLHVGVFRGCLVMQAGVLRAQAERLNDAKRLVFPHLAVGARLGLEWPAEGRWALVTHLDVTAPLIRVTLKVSEAPVWSSLPVSGALAVGALIRL
jgi:hypothetical protein